MTLLPKAAGAGSITRINNQTNIVAYRCNDVGFVFARGRADRMVKGLMAEVGLRRAYAFGEKYTWTEFRRDGRLIVRGDVGRKPKNLPFNQNGD